MGTRLAAAVRKGKFPFSAEPPKDYGITAGRFRFGARCLNGLPGAAIPCVNPAQISRYAHHVNVAPPLTPGGSDRSEFSGKAVTYTLPDKIRYLQLPIDPAAHCLGCATP